MGYVSLPEGIGMLDVAVAVFNLNEEPQPDRTPRSNWISGGIGSCLEMVVILEQSIFRRVS